MGFWAAAIPLAVSAVSSLAAAKSARGDGGAGSTLDAIAAEMRGINAPTAEELTYRLDNMVQQGLISPEQAKTFLVEQSGYNEITDDPRLRGAQMDALSSLANISESGGLTMTDRARLEQITSRQGQEERGGRQAIQQRAAEMGRSGSGLEYADLLMNQQGSAGRASQEGTDLAALAEERALESLTQGASLAGNVRGQDFEQAARKAEAKDTLSKFNAGQLQGTELTNVGARNAAQEGNLAERQRIADENARIAGTNREIASTAKQTAFENELAKKRVVADALTAKAQQQAEKQKSKAAMAGGMAGVAGSVGSALIAKSDERDKDIEGKAPDLDAFMESLRPIAFDYKSGGTGDGETPGRHVGVRAQDVEKTPEGRTMVKNTPHGKMLDMAKAFGLILGSLAELKEEIDEKAA
jgi:hypothetical protein